MASPKTKPGAKRPGRPPELTEATRTTVWLDRESREIADSHGDLSATIRKALKKLGRKKAASQSKNGGAP